MFVFLFSFLYHWQDFYQTWLWVKQSVLYMKQELITLQYHLWDFCLVGSVLLILLGFCVVQVLFICLCSVSCVQLCPCLWSLCSVSCVQLCPCLWIVHSRLLTINTQVKYWRMQEMFFKWNKGYCGWFLTHIKSPASVRPDIHPRV